MIFIFKNFTNKLPKIFSNYYKLLTEKRHSNLIMCNRSKTNILFSHVLRKGPRTWNALINRRFDTSHASLSTFKKSLKFYLNRNYTL